MSGWYVTNISFNGRLFSGINLASRKRILVVNKNAVSLKMVRLTSFSWNMKLTLSAPVSGLPPPPPSKLQPLCGFLSEILADSSRRYASLANLLEPNGELRLPLGAALREINIIRVSAIPGYCTCKQGSVKFLLGLRDGGKRFVNVMCSLGTCWVYGEKCERSESLESK